MEGEYALENKTGKVPRSHHISECNQCAVLLSAKLAGSSWLVVAIELGTMFIKTLTYDEYYLRTKE
jgi:hypothetical protein